MSSPLWRSFNPRPRRGAGATPTSKARSLLSIAFQSSPAPRRGRSMRDSMGCACLFGFNPRPRRGAGAPLHVIPVDQLAHVSILARAEARALLPTYFSASFATWFQSSPAPRRGRSKSATGQHTRLFLFQSSPAPRRGRSVAVQFEDCAALGFNPRPRRGAGAPKHDLDGCLSAMFQSSPAPRRGRSP